MVAAWSRTWVMAPRRSIAFPATTAARQLAALDIELSASID